MALKFLNKKGWHTGSLRNIENVWKAEQKHDGEQKKLEELRKQIHEERERSEFRLLQEQAGLVPKQERLDFLYESGLAVGKSSDGFKALAAPTTAPAPPPAEPSSSKAAVPGALFEDKPQSANDTWRKLHSDPLLLIRQREKEALDRIKNNPMKMAMIKKSVEDEKKQKGDKEDKREKKERKRKHKSKHAKHSSRATPDSEDKSEDDHERRKSKRSSHEQGHRDSSKHEKHPSDEKRKHELSKSEHHEEGGGNNRASGSHSHPSEEKRKHELSKSEHHEEGRRNNRANGSHLQEDRGYGYNRQGGPPKISEEERAARPREIQLDAELRNSSKHEKHPSDEKRKHELPKSEHHEEDGRNNRASGSHSHPSEEKRKHEFSKSELHEEGRRNNRASGSHSHHSEERRKHELSKSEHHEEGRRNNRANGSHLQEDRGYGYNRQRGPPKISEEERAARLREMQLDAELHEEQRWKRLKKAADADAKEAAIASSSSRGKNFLDAAQESIYGAEGGGNFTIEESVRKRKFWSQGGVAAHETNAFRR